MVVICACNFPAALNTVSDAVIMAADAVDKPVKGAIRVAASALVLVKYRLELSAILLVVKTTEPV